MAHKSLSLALALASLLAGASAAGAHPKRYDPDKRAAAEAERIEKGREDGSITYFEGRVLRKEQDAIARREGELKAEHGGHLTKRDRRELKDLQDRADDRITELSTNSWRRWWVLPRVGR